MPREQNDYRATVNVSYELDLWGRLKNATAASRAELLASEAARDTVRLALGADVVRAYFNLRALDEQIAITQRTLALRDVRVTANSAGPFGPGAGILSRGVLALDLVVEP